MYFVIAAVPMVEAMVALVLLDQLMLQRAQGELFPINPALQEPLEHPRVEVADIPRIEISIWEVNLDSLLYLNLWLGICLGFDKIGEG